MKTARYFFTSLLLLACIFCFPAISQASLTVVSVERPPFAFYEDEKLTGFSIELWRVIANRMGLEYKIRVKDSFSGMLDEVKDNKADLAIANISITSERERSMDFSHPIFNSGLQRLEQKQDNSGSIFAALFSSNIARVLLWILLVMLLLAHILYFFKRDALPSISPKYPGGIGDALVLISSGKVGGYLGIISLQKLLIVFRVLGFFFLLTNFMDQVSGGDQSEVSHQDIDLKNKIIGTAGGTTMSAYLERENISFTEYDDFNLALHALEAGEIDMLLGSAATSQYYASHAGRETVSLVGEVFLPDKLAIAFHERASLKESINSTLLKIKEDGTYEYLYNKYFGDY